MVVGICKIKLFIHGSNSLKEKRKSLRKIKDRTQNKFKIRVAEVGYLDNRKTSEVGFSVVSNDSKFAVSLIDKITYFIQELNAGEISDRETDIIHF